MQVLIHRESQHGLSHNAAVSATRTSFSFILENTESYNYERFIKMLNIFNRKDQFCGASHYGIVDKCWFRNL